MLLQHATVSSAFLLLQADTSASVPEQPLHSGNVSQLHRVKERSSCGREMAVELETGTPFFISCCTLPKGICWQGICKSCLVNARDAARRCSDIITRVPVQISPAAAGPWGWELPSLSSSTIRCQSLPAVTFSPEPRRCGRRLLSKAVPARTRSSSMTHSHTHPSLPAAAP